MFISQSEKNCLRFAEQKIAKKYPSQFREHHFRDQREKKAIQKALKYVSYGSKMLDLPSGSGRLTPILLDAGFEVAVADRSLPMLNLAKNNFCQYQSKANKPVQNVEFYQADALKTDFVDNAFDAVICHRLFHHLIDSDTRKKAIQELSRISKGPLIISFFDAASLSTKYKQLKRFLLHKKQKDRISIPLKQFIAELNSQGLSIVKVIPVFSYVSPLTLVVAVKDKEK